MNQLNCELKQQIIEYFDTLQNKLNIVGFSDKRVILPDDIQKAFKYITRVLDQFIEMHQEMTLQYDQLEHNLQKIESENRHHIHIEQRLKIHCDQLQDLLDEKNEQTKTLNMKIELQERQITQLKKEIDIITKRRIDTEKSVTDSQSRFLLVNGVPSQQNMKQMMIKPKTRFVTEALEINKVRSISTIDYSNHSIMLRRNDERNKRSSTIQMLKKK